MTLTAWLLVGVACAYGVTAGFNDGGNLLASLTAGRVLSPGLALLLLAVGVPLGPLLLGTAVARTVGTRIVDLQAQGAGSYVAIVLVAVAVVLLSWHWRLPTSMTLALVGAMVGWTVAAGSGGQVHWGSVELVGAGMVASVLVAALAAGLGFQALHRLLGTVAHRRVLALARAQVVAGLVQAVAYGANDLEKTIGLVGVAEVMGSSRGGIAFNGALPIGAAVLSFLTGTVVGGRRLARRVGSGVVRVRPLQGMVEQFAAGSVVAALALGGIPVSTTQAIDGALVGVGVGERASAVRWGMVRGMLGSWLITPPLAFALALGLRLASLHLGGRP